jgi:hypothetical protein
MTERACTICARPVPAGRMTRGRCERCAWYYRQHGTERPPVQTSLYAAGLLGRAVGERTCTICDRPVPAGRGSYGRCARCARYYQAHGVERPPVAGRINAAAERPARRPDPAPARATTPCPPRVDIPLSAWPTQRPRGLHPDLTPAVIVPHVTILPPSPYVPPPARSFVGRQWCPYCGRKLTREQCPVGCQAEVAS